ncbi:hypothetical protein TNCT_179071 [Trichonephila clavata]|uniref:Uncharacterized protein n=1 Tax=Trichonephila clavata TaxID=2740835 RepID=A0A8X6GSC7_TRICU|nr:hypothetical protein TNCT_179071 [Trichonephila clavata]
MLKASDGYIMRDKDASTSPFVAGWYGVVCLLYVPKNFDRASNRDASNCVPWSVVTLRGGLNLEIQPE